MIIFGIIGLVVMGIILEIVCSSSKECCHWDYDIKAWKVSALETRVYMLENENRRLQFIYENSTRNGRMFHEYMAAHCGQCDRNFYAKSHDEQKIADLLKTLDTRKSIDELAKALDIKIK